MPFTLTHTLAVLPFAKLTKKLPLSALAIGSMVPDLSLYLHMGRYTVGNYKVAHSAIGPISVNLLYGLLVFFIFQYLLKAPLITLLPHWVQQRLCRYAKPFSLSSLKTLALIMLALAIGAYTHIIWDAFTHQGKWGVTLFPILTNDIPWLSIPAYKAFQYGSSLFGLPILAVLALSFLRKAHTEKLLTVRTASTRLKRIAFALFLLIPSSVLVTTFVSHWEVHYALYRTATTSTLILFVLLLIYSIVFKSSRYRSKEVA